MENVIRRQTAVEPRADGRYELYGCIGGEITKVVCGDAPDGVLVVITVHGMEKRCS